MNPFEILKLTPKTNCGQCGHPACLAFSAAVAKSGEDPGKCPYLDLTGLKITPPAGVALDQLSRERDLQLIQHLKEKVAPLNFAEIAAGLGAEYRSDEPDRLSLAYLGQAVTLIKNKGIVINGVEPEDPRDQILLYNFVHSRGGAAPNRDWVGLESLPNSISKVKTLATYGENRLAELFARTENDKIIAACSQLGGREAPESTATLGIVVEVLPRIPQYILYWAAEAEEGFAAKVKILFDREVMNFLDLESLVFSAERMADKIAELLGDFEQAPF
ncbi:MAG: DUF3786 domain-containing protein [Desulfobulbaceae bacterium]|nr:DUF3786 domain-containing protein [Desulfobulbaceae bacterium]